MLKNVKKKNSKSFNMTEYFATYEDFKKKTKIFPLLKNVKRFSFNIL